MPNNRFSLITGFLLLSLLFVGCSELDPLRAEPANSRQARFAFEAQIDEIIALLEPAGLVFEIGQTVEVDGQDVTLRRLVVDREMVFLEHERGRRTAFRVVLLDDQQQEYHAWANGQHWSGFRGLDPATRNVTVRLTPHERNPTEFSDVTVLVDLAPLQQLPAPQPVTGSVVANGVRFESGNVTRGVAISTIELTSSVVDRQALRFADGRAISPGTLPDIVAANAHAAGAQIPVLEVLDHISGTTWEATLPLIGVPDRGDLHLTINEFYYKGLDLGAQNTKDGNRNLAGPWELKLSLDRD